jgi:hypothetical protein
MNDEKLNDLINSFELLLKMNGVAHIASAKECALITAQYIVKEIASKTHIDEWIYAVNTLESEM